MYCLLCVKEFTNIEDFKKHILENHQFNDGIISDENMNSELSEVHDEDHEASDEEEKCDENEEDYEALNDPNEDEVYEMKNVPSNDHDEVYEEDNDKNDEVYKENIEASNGHDKDNGVLEVDDDDTEDSEADSDENDEASNDQDENDEVYTENIESSNGHDKDDGVLEVDDDNTEDSEADSDENDEVYKENIEASNVHDKNEVLEVNDDDIEDSEADSDENDEVLEVDDDDIEESEADSDENVIKLSVNNLQQKHNEFNTNKPDSKISASDRLIRKRKTSSSLKKPVQKKNKTISSNKTLPQQRQPVSSYKKGFLKNSHTINESDQSVSSSNENNGLVNSQFAIGNNYFNPLPVPINSFVNSQPISSNPVFFCYPSAAQNAPIFVANGYGSAAQNISNYFMKNEGVQPPFFVANPFPIQFTVSQNSKRFVFNSQNVLNWLTKFKMVFKNMPYPLSPSLYKSVNTMHRDIFNFYFTMPVREESAAVLKVYEELDCIIHKHMNAIHNGLNN